MTTIKKVLKALEIEKEGDWDKAHRIVQDIEHELAYWVHAYLHRKEPDISNAYYWYSRAGKPMPEYSYEKEWDEIYTEIEEMEQKKTKKDLP